MKATRIEWCPLAEKDHKKERRIYAHTYHRKNIICVCEDFFHLPPKHSIAIIGHEVGHLIAGKKGGERDANTAINNYFYVKIRYVNSPWGRHLEYVDEIDMEMLLDELTSLLHPASLKLIEPSEKQF